MRTIGQSHLIKTAPRIKVAAKTMQHLAKEVMNIAVERETQDTGAQLNGLLFEMKRTLSQLEQMVGLDGITIGGLTNES